MKAIQVFLLSATVLFSSHVVFSQDSLQVEFDNLLQSSETYQQFKVIPQTRLNEFWGQVIDSLQTKESTNEILEEKIADLEIQVEELGAELNDVKGELAESQELTDTISFFGSAVSEGTYHLIVWALIAVLAGLGIFSYVLFLRANQVTSRSRRELTQLTQEFEDHRTKAREKQVKLKRELQTAVNQLSEKR